MNRLINRLALPLCAVVIAFIGYTTVTQLSVDASPAITICAQAQRQGVPCEVVPTKYDAQVIVVTDALGNKSGFLIVTQGKEVIAQIPLN